ncbi:MAG TPA: S1 family peptidase, partial [Polyangiaceae bacterium]|nr:S1 family peptidase [Polyangiaceae bacterium]
ANPLPAVGALGVFATTGEFKRTCTVTMIAPDWALTAAHCVYNAHAANPFTLPRGARVCNNVTHLNDCSSAATGLVTAAYVHPNWDGHFNHGSDAALLRLDRALTTQVMPVARPVVVSSLPQPTPALLPQPSMYSVQLAQGGSTVSLTLGNPLDLNAVLSSIQANPSLALALALSLGTPLDQSALNAGIQNNQSFALSLGLPLDPSVLSISASLPLLVPTVTAVGFGWTSASSTANRALNQITFSVLDDATTRNTWTNVQAQLLPPEQRLAFPESAWTTIFGTAASSTASSCKGDSGGPLLNGNGVQVGIVSAGDPYCTGLVPDVHTDVQSISTWALNCATGKTVPCSISVPMP